MVDLRPSITSGSAIRLVIYGDLYYQNAASHDDLAPSATG